MSRASTEVAIEENLCFLANKASTETKMGIDPRCAGVKFWCCCIEVLGESIVAFERDHEASSIVKV